MGFGQLGCTLTTLYGLDYLHAHKLQGLVIILTTIVFWFAFHALDYSRLNYYNLVLLP